MKTRQTYLKGKSVFIVSLLVIAVTILTIHLTGINFNRSLTANLYWSLGIIATILFLFMTLGLYLGIKLRNNFPKFKDYKTGDYITNSGITPDLPDFDAGEGLVGFILSVVWWVLITLVMIILLTVLEAVFWFSLFIILAMLYWVFFKALQVVFRKSARTKNKLAISLLYAFTYTILYTGWIFGVVYLTAHIV